MIFTLHTTNSYQALHKRLLKKRIYHLGQDLSVVTFSLTISELVDANFVNLLLNYLSKIRNLAM